MPRVLLFCLLALVVSPPPAHSDDLLFRRLDGDSLDTAETRLLQTALAAAGDYPDPPDGAWGPVSQRALESYASREFDDAPRNLYAAALVIGLIDVVEAGGWSQRQLDGLGVSLALPAALAGGDGDPLVWRNGSLRVRARALDPAAALGEHAAAAARAEPATLRTQRRDVLMVTEGRQQGGRRFHLRSDLVDGRWPTVEIEGGPEVAGDLDLIRASIRPGPPAAWDIPAGGALELIVAGTLTLLEEPWQAIPAGQSAVPPQTAALPPIAPDIEATGSGFYISDRLLVTAEHVVHHCARVALADGTLLAVVAADRELDVAALSAPRPTPAWLSLARTGRTRLGERVHAAGFPYYSIAGTSLHLTGGNVSALAGVDDDRRFFSFTAPIQPGNSGGPLIDGSGEVLGVVVSRLSESFISETTGSLPQNINYALSTAELAGFLRDAGLRPVDGGLGGFDMDRGAPDGIEAAVVPIICR